MAGLDTTIALGIKPVDFGDPNEGRMNALRAQMMQMQMQQGQFNMMKAQRDMQYQDQQRAQAAAAAARDKAAEAQAIALYGRTGAPGYQSYSPSMEPGAASDVGMLGGGQGYTEGAINRLAMPAQPKNFDDAITAALQAGKLNPDVARKLMALKEAQNVYTKSNLGVDEATTKNKKGEIELAKADLERGAKAIEFHASALPTVTPETWGAWRENAIKDLPGLKQILPETAPADPTAFDQLKRSLILKAQDSVKQHYQSVTRGGETGVVAIDPVKLTATNVAGSEGTVKPAKEPKSKIAQLIEDRDNLDPKDPEFNIKSKIYEQAIQQETGVKSKDVATADATIANVEQNIKDIDALIKHPALKRNTGLLGAVNPASRVPGTADKDFDLRLQQVKGEAFLSAYNILRGAGAITEIEGTKATSAINRMNTALSTKDFLKAAEDAQDILKLGAERAKNMKSKGTWGGGEMRAPGAASTPAPPAGGKVVNFEDLK